MSKRRDDPGVLIVGGGPAAALEHRRMRDELLSRSGGATYG
jgi:hypothetical protein